MGQGFKARSVGTVLIALVAVACASCGSADTQVKGTGQDGVVNAPRTFDVSFGAFAASGDSNGGAIVRSSAESGRPQAIVTNLQSGEQIPLPDGPVYGLSSWVGDDVIGVIGATCPNWTSGAPPHWNDDSDSNVPEACGQSTFRVRLVDRRTGHVSTVDTDGLNAGNGYVARQTENGRVLLIGQGLNAKTLTLDAGSGGIRVLPTAPETGGSAEAFFDACLSADGTPFGVLTWSGDAPPVVETAGWVDSAVTAKDGTAMVALAPSEEDQWGTMSWGRTPPADATFAGVGGCGAAGLWRAGPGGGIFVTVHDGTADATPIGAPPVDAANEQVQIMPLLGGGPPLAARQSGVNPKAPDAPVSTAGFLYSDGEWTAIDAVDLSSSSAPFLSGNSISARQMRGNAVTLEVARS